MRIRTAGGSPQTRDGGDDEDMRRRKAAWQKRAQQGLKAKPAPGTGQPAVDGAAAVEARLRMICEDGRAVWRSFETEVRHHRFHTFVPGDYEGVLEVLVALRHALSPHGPALRFLELGSATGVIAILADLIGYEAWGIEIDGHLVEVARDLARRHGSAARFAAGSYLPGEYRWQNARGDRRLGTIGEAAPAYAALGRQLSDFDVVYAYPWEGEQEIFHDLMARCGAPDAWLLLHGGEGEVKAFREGEEQVGVGSGTTVRRHNSG